MEGKTNNAQEDTNFSRFIKKRILEVFSVAALVQACKACAEEVKELVEEVGVDIIGS